MNTKRINLYGERMAASPFEKELADYRRQHLAQQLEQMPHANILEIGCGIAPIAAVFKSFRRMTVVEPYAPFADKARRLARKNPNITVLRGFLADHTDALRRRKFDCIILSGVLHEVDDPAAMLRDIAGIAQDAVVYVSVPNARSFHRLLGVEAGLIADVHATSALQKKLNQPWAFDMTMLRRTVRAAGFRIVKEGYYAFKPFTHAQMEKLMTQKILNKNILNALFRMTKHAPQLGSEMFVELKMR